VTLRFSIFKKVHEQKIGSRTMTNPPEPINAFELLRASPDDTPNIKLLRFAVIGMGVVLALGLVAVFGRLFYLATRPVTQAGTSSSAAVSVNAATGGDVRMALPTGAKIRSHAISGSQLSVLYEAATGDGIVVFDLETNRQRSHVRFVPESSLDTSLPR
jgi:hypothetical protein